jgi:hypothetical protein
VPDALFVNVVETLLGVKSDCLNRFPFTMGVPGKDTGGAASAALFLVAGQTGPSGSGSKIAEQQLCQITAIVFFKWEPKFHIIATRDEPSHRRIALDPQLFYVRREPRHSAVGMGKI